MVVDGLQVGGNFPLYGCCWYVREMLHRPPYLARQQYRSCRAPFRQCMIAAPRCYCLLSHYPFFDLHFKVSRMRCVLSHWGDISLLSITTTQQCLSQRSSVAALRFHVCLPRLDS